MHSASVDDPNKLDVIFLSYLESNSDRNWLSLRQKVPWAKRVHGVRGIQEAHLAAAQKSETDFFFLVDGDNRISESFSFDRPDFSLEDDSVYVYRCFNPANDLCYGYGAVKIYNKKILSRENQMSNGDLATSVAKNYRIIHEKASSTYFFEEPFEAWRGAFRECAKLSSQLEKDPSDQQTRQRLSTWCEQVNSVINASWILLGAQQGREFGRMFGRNMNLINDFQWLKERYLRNA